MIPISTDAPIYHFPYATIGMIIANVVCFFAICLPNEDRVAMFVDRDGNVYHDEAELDERISQFDENDRESIKEFVSSLIVRRTDLAGQLSVEFQSFKPWQWLTNNFMHINVSHLVGNMIFLWAFGLIVEGKVGAVLFSIIYLGVGTVYGLTLQMLSFPFGWNGYALGASAAIFGLLAICVAWAPANEFTVLWRFSTFDVSILLYGGLFFLKEVLFLVVLHQFTMSSELLHILGFCVAFPLGLWMVKQGHVDCEGWDLISYWTGTHGNTSTIGKAERQKREKLAQKKEVEAAIAQKLISRPSEQRTTLRSQVSEFINEGKYELAVKFQNRLMQNDPAQTWAQSDLYRIIQLALKDKNYALVEPLIEKHIESFAESQFALQTILLKLWLHANQPRRALRYMQGINTAFLAADHRSQLIKLADAAKTQIANGVTETRLVD